ncbi:hypothetical protein D9M68_977040 [compost metagenome]
MRSDLQPGRLQEGVVFLHRAHCHAKAALQAVQAVLSAHQHAVREQLGVGLCRIGRAHQQEVGV